MKSAGAGFTLIELLVVMAILAIGAAAVGPRLWGMQEGNPSRDIPRQVQDMIDKLRSDAIFQSRSQGASIDFDANQLHLRDSDHGWSPPAGWQLQPADGASQDPDGNAGNQLLLEFLPDGTARAARFDIAGPDGHRGWHVAISPLTGRSTFSTLADDAAPG